MATARSFTACLLASLLPVLAGCGGESATPLAPSRQEIALQKLRQVVSIDVENEPFDEVLARIAREYGLSIEIDMETVRIRNHIEIESTSGGELQGSISLDWAPLDVSLHLRNIQLRSALHILLRGPELTYEVIGGVVRVSTPEEIAKLEVGRVHPVADLVGLSRNWAVEGESDTVVDEADLAHLLREMFPSVIGRPNEFALPKTDSVDEPSFPEGIASHPGVVVVSRPPSVQDEIARILADLRQLNDPSTPPPSPRLTLAEEAIEAALAKPVSVFYLDKPLADVARELAREHGINILLDRDALKDAGIVPEDTLIRLDLSEQKLPLRDVLRLMLRELGLTYTIGWECVWITSFDEIVELPFLYPRFYAIDGLLDPLWNSDVDTVAGVIGDHVRTVMWDVSGGGCWAEAVPGGLLIFAPQEIHEKIAAPTGFLAQLRAATDPTVVDYDPRTWPTPRHKQMEAKLEETTRCDISDKPLDEAVKYFSKRHDVPMLFNRRALEDAGITASDVLVTLRRRDVPLRAALEAMLSEIGLDFYIDSSGRLLIVTSKDDADACLITRLYRVGGLTNQTNGPDVDDLSEMIPNVIKPDSWQDAGGPGPVDQFGSALVITQTEEAHREIAQLLDSLSKMFVEPSRRWDYGPLPHSAVRASLEAKLDEPAKLKFELIETPLLEMAEAIRKQHGLPITMDRRALEDAGVVPEDALITRSLKNLSLRTALTLILAELGLDFVLLPEQRTLLVTSKDDAEFFLTTRLYGLGGIVGEQGYDSDALIEMLAGIVDADSWQDNGGPGSVEMFGPALIVTQTDRGHREIRKVLASLAQFLAKQPPTADLVVGADANYRKLQAALAKPTTIKIKDGTLADFRTLLSRQRPEVVFYFDRRALEDANVVPEELHMSINLTDVPLRTLLDRVFQPHGLDWLAEDNVIQITGIQAIADVHSPPVIYHISAKLRAAGLDEEKLKALIEGHVWPKRALGAVAQKRGGVHVVPGGVIVGNVYFYARQTREFMEKLRTHPDPKRFIQHLAAAAARTLMTRPPSNKAQP